MQPCGASHIRNENRRQIFRLLCSRNATSKIELSRLSGISAPTVMKIIDFLAGQGLLTFLGAGPGEHGRRPQLFCLNEKRYAALGVLVEGDWVKVGLIDLRGQLTAMKKEARTQSLHPVSIVYWSKTVFCGKTCSGSDWEFPALLIRKNRPSVQRRLLVCRIPWTSRRF